MRRADRALYPGLAAVTERTVIGVVAGTTSERYTREHFERSSMQIYPAPGDAVTELTQNRIDLALADLAIVVWMVSRNEAELALLRHKIGDEPLARAFRRDEGGCARPRTSHRRAGAATARSHADPAPAAVLVADPIAVTKLPLGYRIGERAQGIALRSRGHAAPGGALTNRGLSHRISWLPRMPWEVAPD